MHDVRTPRCHAAPETQELPELCRPTVPAIGIDARDLGARAAETNYQRIKPIGGWDDRLHLYRPAR